MRFDAHSSWYVGSELVTHWEVSANGVPQGLDGFCPIEKMNANWGTPMT